MPAFNRTANAEWNGDLKSGKGTVSTESGAISNVAYDFTNRFEQGGQRTNPEELLGAAHAGCFSMALANMLAKEGHEPTSIQTEATVTLDMSDGPKVTKVTLTTTGNVPGIDEATFESFASKAKDGCPVSGALGALEIELAGATLTS